MRIEKRELYRDPRNGNAVEVLNFDDAVVKIRHQGGLIEYVKKIFFCIKFTPVYRSL